MSAAGLKDDARTGRLATELLKRRPIALKSLDLALVVAPLVRQSIARNDIDGAVSLLKEARSIGDPATATTLEIWIAEVYARADRPDGALQTYMRLIKPDAAGAALALDAGEMMLDNGHLDEAKILLLLAGDMARRNGRQWIERRARQLLDRMP
jgi:hypothetical protein